MSLVCFKTSIPFGVEKNGNSTFIRLKLEKEHDDLKSILLNMEKNLDSTKTKVSCISSLKKYDLLKIKVKNFKNKLIYKISYNNNEKYLSTLNEIDKYDIIDVRFSINEPYTYFYNNITYTGLSLYLDEIILQ